MTTSLTLTKKDFVFDWFSGTGAGGQHRNKHKNCLRLLHPASGVRVVAQEHRSRTANRKLAMERLVADPKFRAWCMVTLAALEMETSIERLIEEQLSSENLLIEVRESGRWVEQTNKEKKEV